LAFPLVGKGQGLDSIPMVSHYKMAATSAPFSLKPWSRSLKKITSNSTLQIWKTELTQDFYRSGFAGFALDSTPVMAQDTQLIIWKEGPRFIWKTLRLDSVHPEAKSYGQWKKTGKPNHVFNQEEIERKFTQTLIWYQNRGYPFAGFQKSSLELDTFTSQTVGVSAKYQLISGKSFTIDSLHIEGKIRESSRFVSSLVRIKPGDIYNHEAIENIPLILNNSIYYQNVDNPQIYYHQNSAEIWLKLNPRKSSRIDGVLGFLPPIDSTAKLQLTGLLDFQLVSPLGIGELVALKFEQLPGSSQRLSIKYNQPYWFGTPIKSQLEFQLQKQDSSFVTRWIRVSPGWQFSRNISLFAFVRFRNSVLLSTRNWEKSKIPPPVLDSKDQLAGLGFEFEKLDYKLNPSNGFIFKIDYGTGFKQIFRNPGLDSLDYNSITTWLPKQEFHLETWWFTRTFKRQVLVLGNRSFKLQQSEYFRNDLAQIGGARLLRGFNENQFFTNAYTVFSFEYRYLLDKNSHVLLFYDLSQIVLTEQGRRSVQTPKGVGVGINFETRAGILNLTFASGQIGQEAFNFARPRVHLGIVSQF